MNSSNSLWNRWRDEVRPAWVIAALVAMLVLALVIATVTSVIVATAATKHHAVAVAQADAPSTTEELLERERNRRYRAQLLLLTEELRALKAEADESGIEFDGLEHLVELLNDTATMLQQADPLRRPGMGGLNNE